MGTNGYFVKIIFKTFKPRKLVISDKTLLIALENYFFPEIIPDKYLKKFRSFSSQIYTQLSYYGLLTSRGRFIPEKAFGQWKIDNEKIIKDFDNYKKDLILSYNTLEQFIKEANKDMIINIWNTLHEDAGSPTENFIIETNKKIIGLLPSKEDLYNSISCRIIVFPAAKLELNSKTNSGDKFLTQEIKGVLISIISNAFDKIIDFYNIEKQIRNNMLESFKKEINRIFLLYFFEDISGVVQKILEMLNNEEYKINPASFIDKLSVIKKDLVKKIEK